MLLSAPLLRNGGPMKSYAQRMKEPQIANFQQSTAATAHISNQAVLGMLNEPDGDTRFSEALRAKFEAKPMPQSERSRPMALTPYVLQKAEERYQTSLAGIKAYEDTGLLDSGYNGYAQGNEIHIDDSLAPTKREEVLMHEIGHVVQCGSGMVHGSGLLDNPELEKQADQGFIAPPNFSIPTTNCGPILGGRGNKAGSDELYASEEMDDFASEDDSAEIFTTQYGKGNKGKHSSQSNFSNQNRSQQKLDNDATEAHKALDDCAQGRKTTATAKFQIKSRDGLKQYLYVAAANSRNMPRASRAALIKKGYHPIVGVTTHAEANLLLYALKHIANARLLAFGCDKESCPQCVSLLKRLVPRVTRRERALVNGKKKYSNNYKFQLIKRQNIKNPIFQRLLGHITKHYSEDGKLKPSFR